jgi:hypothetical protein
MLTKQTQIFTEVEIQLQKICSANDAEDHHYMDSTSQMRAEASASLYSLVEQNPGLLNILPTILTELDTGHIYGFGWSVLLNHLSEFRARMKK